MLITRYLPIIRRQSILSITTICQTALLHGKVYFFVTHQHTYLKAKPGTFRLVPRAERLPQLRRDYQLIKEIQGCLLLIQGQGHTLFTLSRNDASCSKKLLGLIFPAKLVFKDGRYRTTELNKTVELIGLFQKNLRNKKAEHFDIAIKTFGNVARTGIEPATQGFSVLCSTD